jgi:hypothetical protein
VSADDKQTPHLGIASLADPTELLSPSSRELSGNESNPSREVSPGSKLGGVRDRGRDQRGCDGADAGNCCEAAADLVGAVPGNQPIVEMVDPLVEIADHDPQRRAICKIIEDRLAKSGKREDSGPSQSPRNQRVSGFFTGDDDPNRRLTVADPDGAGLRHV